MVKEATLAKFGVPIDRVNQGILMPKQRYRFRVMWYGFGDVSTTIPQTNTMTGSVVSCTRPKITYEEKELHAYNSVAWIMGKHSLETIEIKIRDDITNSVVSSVGAQLQKQLNQFEQTSAVAGINYKFTMEIHSLDGTKNDELESWFLEGCWVKDVAYDEGAYDSSDTNVVTLTIRYDNATQWAGVNTNNGTTVGGNPFPNLPSPTGGTTFA